MLLSERCRIRHAFEQAHANYDNAAHIQREIATHLVSLLPHSSHYAHVLDAGCGTGFGLQLLQQKLMAPESRYTALDLAHSMLTHVHTQQKITADLSALPLASHSVDLYWSSLAWQWVNPQQALREAQRVVKPGGILCVATLGEQTLHELKDVFAQIDNARHVRDFAAYQNYAGWLAQANFELLHSQRVVHPAYFANLKHLFAHLKALGAHTVGEGRRRTPLGKQAWQAMQIAYEKYRHAQHGLPASYDAIYLLARRKS